jgi:hypothetical protein
MNTDDTPLLPHGGYRKLRSYPDEIQRYEDRRRRNFLPCAASENSTTICVAFRIIAGYSGRIRNRSEKESREHHESLLKLRQRSI